MPGGTRWTVLTRVANAAAVTMASTNPRTWSLVPRQNRSRSRSTVPALVAMAGPMSGAMTIEPTTTAAESSSTPAVAMATLATAMTTNVLTSGVRSLARARSSSRAMRSGVPSAA